MANSSSFEANIVTSATDSTGAQVISIVQSNVIESTNVTANVITGGVGETGAQGADGAGVPTGGTTGQVLSKASDLDFDAAWVTAGGVGSVDWGAIGGDLSDQTDLQSALDAKVPTSRTINGNSLSSNVTLDADDIDDSSTTHKFVTSNDLTKLSNLSGTNTGDQDLSGYATTASVAGGYQPLDSDLTALAAMTAPATKLAGIETGAEVNNISDANTTDLTDSGDTTLHYHAADRSRANHTGTQLLSTISDVTATAAELNVLDGVTASTAELNYVDGVTSDIQTQLNNSAKTNQANTFSAGSKQTVSHDSTNAGFNLGNVAGNPSSPSEGDVWYNSTLDEIVWRAGAANRRTTSIDGTQTLTNKRVTKRVGTTTSSATPTINTDNYDVYGLTAQAADITSFTTNLSGTPTDGQTLWIYIVGTATRNITWGASFEASTVALPTATTSTNRLDTGFVWNAATSKWRCVAVA